MVLIRCFDIFLEGMNSLFSILDPYIFAHFGTIGIRPVYIPVYYNYNILLYHNSILDVPLIHIYKIFVFFLGDSFCLLGCPKSNDRFITK